MQTTNRLITHRLIPGLVLGFLVLIGLALLGDLRAVSQTLIHFRWEFFLGALGFTLLNYALRFLKWHFYLNQVGVRTISWGQSLRLFVAGFPLAVTPGKVGEVLKAVWLKRLSGLPVARGVSVVVAERISDGLAVMLLSTVGVFAYPQFWPAFTFILVVLLLVVILSQFRPVVTFFLDQGERLPFAQRAISSLREFYEGSFLLLRPAPMLLAVLLGTISWFGEGIGFYLILLGLGLEPSIQLLASAIFVLAFSTAVGAASALPGGLGAAEVSIAGMLTLILYREPALISSATLLIRLATLWFGVGLGLLTWSLSMNLLGLRTEQEWVAEA
jgi:glycosyltransferase 2 family protein